MKLRLPWVRSHSTSDAQVEIAQRTIDHEAAIEHAERALREASTEIRRMDRLLSEYAEADREREA